MFNYSNVHSFTKTIHSAADYGIYTIYCAVNDI